jgi:NAD(P)-dependent dehydrogenase (short-subunit alcohol dehydrogenase family)
VGKVIPTNRRDGDNMIDLSGKVAAVTGAAGGIGAEVARTLARAGAKVVLGDVQAERGEQVAEQIREAGGQAIFVAHDTSVEDQWIAFIDTALDHFGGLDILVNNAGIEQTCFIENITVADIQKLLSVNVTGVLIGHKHAVRAMKPGGRAGKGGSIVNLSSVAGLIGTPALGCVLRVQRRGPLADQGSCCGIWPTRLRHPGELHPPRSGGDRHGRKAAQ